MVFEGHVMKSKTKYLTTITGLLLIAAMASCNGKNNCEILSESDSDSETTSSETDTSYDEDEYIDGYVEGYSDGYSDGQEEGYEDGYSDGQEDGYSEGYDDGYEDGKEDQEKLNHDYRSIHTEAQLEYLNSKNYRVVPEGIDGLSEKSKPLPLEFSIQESPLFDFSEITSSKLVISEDQNFTSSIEVDGNNAQFQVYNLKINTKYYYYYYAVTTHGTFYSDIKEVNVENEAPRLLNIDGVTNARDDGGWKITGEDKYTAQGVIYRTGRLHTSSSKNITTEGIKAIKALGIKTEIDLRGPEDNNDVYQSAVDGVTYYNCPMNLNNSFFTNESNRESIKDVLELLADKTNYPLMFHCSIGTDRTGFISFLINALAGVEEEFLYRDYLMSNYANIGGTRDDAAITNYIYTLKGDYEGVTDLSLGAKNYMLDLGLNETQINTIKDILLGNTAI